jgi:tetratricopeptide (TPR) repeat protein
LSIDDLHLADDDLLDTLEYVAGGSIEAPLLLVCTARPEFLDDRPAWVDHPSVRLQPLEPGARRLMLEALLSGGALGGGLGERLTDASGGNPLFLTEIVRMLVEDGSLVRSGDLLVTSDAPEQVSVPESVTAVLQARLDLLSGDARRVLECAAVIGPVFTTEAVEALAPEQIRTDVDRHLADLSDREFVRHEVEFGTDRFRFRHVQLRDATYAAMTKASRASTHERYGTWLVSSETSRGTAELIGSHFESAFRLRTEIATVGDRERGLAGSAATWLAHAAEEAANRGKREQAIDDLGRACAMALASENPSVRAGVGITASRLGEWDAALDLLTEMADPSDARVFKYLGVALTQRNREEPKGEPFRRGQQLLERAASLDATDADAVATLAGTWRGLDDARAHALYVRALERDPSDPYALGNHLEYELAERGDLSPILGLRTQIEAATKRRRAQADAAVDLPWCWYDLGRFALLLDRPDEALYAYAKGVERSSVAFMVRTSLASLDRLAPVAGSLQGRAWAEQLLLLALAGLFDDSDATGRLSAMATPSRRSIVEPVIVFAGGSSTDVDEHVRAHGEALRVALRGFGGTLISGGTTQGVAALAGDVAAAIGARSIGYLPSELPTGVRADTDAARYSELRITGGVDFSPLEPLAYWTDLVADGLRPRDVRVIGIGGGRLAAIEYRLALALGAVLCIFRGSGREADEVLADPDWAGTDRLVDLAARRDDLRAFFSLEGGSNEVP